MANLENRDEEIFGLIHQEHERLETQMPNHQLLRYVRRIEGKNIEIAPYKRIRREFVRRFVPENPQECEIADILQNYFSALKNEVHKLEQVSSSV